MRLILVCLTALLLVIQFPLWLGKGGWLHVWELDQQVGGAHARNDGLKARNDKLASEVRDLKEGTGAIEERARTELGMIKSSEIFIQILAAGTTPPPETIIPEKNKPAGKPTGAPAAQKAKPPQAAAKPRPQVKPIVPEGPNINGT
ncbi:MAG: cell division protein FtsB [Janthinobacterium lividum]